MTPEVIEIGTRGKCLLCLGDCQNDGITTKTTNMSSPPTTLAAIKMLLRYLKVDTKKFGQHSPSFYSFIYGTGGGADKLVLSLCCRCTSLAAQFLRLFQILEGTRMEIVTCVGKIHRSIIAEKGDPNYDDIARVLRKETREKCARLTSSKPKVLLGVSSLPVRYSKAELILKEESCDFDNDVVDSISTLFPSIKREPTSPPQTSTLFPPSPLSDIEIETQDEILLVKSEGNHLDESYEEPPPVLVEAVPYHPDTDLSMMEEDSDDDEIPVLFRQDTLEITSSTNSSRPKERLTEDPDYDPATDLTKKKNSKSKKSDPPPNPRRCIHCGRCFCSVNILETHYIIHHTFEHFSQRLPSEITESQWTQALDSILAEHTEIPTPIYGKAIHKCHLCPTTTFHNGFRKHILVNHFDDILAVCKSPSSVVARSIPPPPPPPECGEDVDDEGSDNDLKSIRTQRLKLPGGKCKCLICGETLGKLNNFGRHYREIHAKKKFTCIHCNLAFSRPGRVTEHLERAHPALHFADQLPPDTTDEEVAKAIESLKKTEISPTGSEGLRKCLVCRKKFRRTYEVKQHILETHMEEIASAVEKKREEHPVPPTEKRRKLEEAPSIMELENGRDVDKAPSIVEADTRDPRKSTSSNRERVRRGSSPPGKSRKHDDGSKRVVDLGRKAALKHRVKLPDGKCMCLICGQTLRRAQAYRRHYIELHVGVKVRCVHCDVRFTRHDRLTRHMTLIHPSLKFADQLPPNTTNDEVWRAVEYLKKTGKNGTGESNSKDKECRFCCKKYREPYKLKMHLVEEHTEEVASAVEKVREENELFWKYKCPECGNTFSDIDALRRHRLEAHTGFMHKCNYCDEQFRRRVRVTTHERTEHAVEVFRDRFPPGTTDDEVTKVLVEDLCVYFVKKKVQEHDASGKSYEINRQQWHCLLCNKVFTWWKPSDKREHIVRCHMDKIVAALVLERKK